MYVCMYVCRRKKNYLKQSGLFVDQWEKWLQIEVSGGN